MGTTEVPMKREEIDAIRGKISNLLDDIFDEVEKLVEPLWETKDE